MFGSNLSAMRGLLDDEDLFAIQRDAGLQRALGLLAASGPSSTPTSFGTVLLEGLKQGREAEQAGLKNLMQSRELMQKAQSEQRRKNVLGMLGGNESGELSVDKFKRALVAAVETGDPELIKYVREAKDSLFPTFKTHSIEEIEVDGKLKKFAIGEDASRVELGVAPEDLVTVNAGGITYLVGKNTAKDMGKFNVTMTPSEIGNLAVAKGNLAVSQGNLAMRQREFDKPSYEFIKVDDTVVTGNKNTGELSSKGGMSKSQQQVMGAANAVLEAKDLIPKSTGSLLGASADFLASTIGKATEGGKNIASLNVLGAKLVSNVPRFEGPQSNYDVELYKQAAADVANPLKPPAVRMAALKTAADLIAKDAEIKGIKLPSEFSQFISGAGIQKPQSGVVDFNNLPKGR